MAERESLIQVLADFTNKNIEDAPNFKAAMWFRSYLLSVPILIDIANHLTTDTNFDISDS